MKRKRRLSSNPSRRRQDGVGVRGDVHHGDDPRLTVFSWRSPMVWHIGFAAISIVLYLAAGQTCKNPDAFTYAQYGKLLIQGDGLYASIVLDKPAFVPILYALPQLLVANSFWVFQVLLAIILAVQAALILKVLHPNLATGIFISVCVLFIPLCESDWSWLSTEHLSNTFVLAVLLICWRVSETQSCSAGASVAIGVLLGLGFLTRQTTATNAIVPTLTLMFLSSSGWLRVRSFAMIVMAGAATVALSVAAVAILGGDSSRYLYVLFEHPRNYAGEVSVFGLGLLSFPFPYAELGQVAALWTLGVFWSCFSKHRVVLVSGLVAGLLSVKASPNSYSHYTVSMLPSIVVALGVCLSTKSGIAGRAHVAISQASPFFSSSLIAMLLPSILFHATQTIAARDDFPRIQSMAETARYLDAQYPAAKTAWIVAPAGYEYILFASDKRPAHPLRTAWEIDAPSVAYLYGDSTRIESEYVASPPDLIVVHRAYFDWLEEKANPGDIRDGSFTPSRRLFEKVVASNYSRSDTIFTSPAIESEQYVFLIRAAEAQPQ